MSQVISRLADPIYLTDAELSEAIEAAGANSARLYARGLDTTEVDSRLDDLIAEFERRQQTTRQRDEVSHAVPTNEYDAGSEPVYSVFAPHYRTGNLIARDISFARARQIAEHHGAFVYYTTDLPAA
ncbi:MAG: hypothetical protein ACYC0H_19930 [Solirubrobacteraceae bacterium]